MKTCSRGGNYKQPSKVSKNKSFLFRRGFSLNRYVFLLFFGLGVVLLQIRPTQAQSLPDFPREKLINPEDIVTPFEQGQPTVRVIVNLSKPPEILRDMDWNSREALNVLHSKVRARQEIVLAELTAGEFKLRRRFENQAAFSAEVTLDGLTKLLNNPMVESVEPVYLLKLHLAQGIPLINGLAYRSTYNGQGVAIAICDTGIDYNHSKLGGGGFPNSKVIGGYDFGDDDDDPIPQSEAHGTCCAGIAAGDPGAVGDYIGGVAYDAKLYALKVEDSSGTIYVDYIISAWDWCISHKNDDPCNPILVISNSIGTTVLYSSAALAESANSSWASAANRVVAAGITILASSGNDGSCNSLAAPAAFSSVISIGAVYDASLGDIGFCTDPASCTGESYPSCSSKWACFNTPSAADMVTCYSNTASFLDLLAPSHDAYTTDIVGSGGYASGDYYSEFGGTSAACPYAAGAVACLQSAAKDIRGGYLIPSEAKTILTSTGDNVTDGKVAITKPRVNLGGAIDSLGTAPPGKATEPSPADGAAEVGTSSDISWTAGGGATSHDVYFGTVSPGTFRGNQTGTTYDPGALLVNTTYYWRIDEKNANGTTTGDVWSFTTASPLPWSDGFESGNFTAGGWTTAGSNPVPSVTTGAKYTGAYGAQIPGSSSTRSITKNKNTEGYNLIHVKYDRKVTRTTSITLTVDWSADGGSSWTTLETVSGSTSWASKDWALVTAADNNPNFRIRFRTTAGSSSRYAYIDNVQITGTQTQLQYTISGNAGAAGVTMNGLPSTPVSGANGNYTGTVNYGFSGTVTPSKAGYTFSPVSRTYTSVTSNQTSQDYTATLLTYTISGNAGTNGAVMNGLPGNPVSDSNGNYTGTVNYGFSGMVTPAKTGYTFDPNSRTYANVTSDQLSQSYTATILTYTVTATAGANGTVEPNSVVVNYGASQDFNAVPSTGYEVDKWTLDGNDVQTGGNTYTLSNITANHAVGVTFKILTYTVTATAGANGTVEPTSVVVNYGASQDFNAIPNLGYEVNKWYLDGNSVQNGGATYTLEDVTADHTVYVTFKELIFVISGYVLEQDGNTPVEGVPIQTDDNDINSVTDANGYYELLVDYDWSGIVIPQKEGYVFEPNGNTYTNVTQDYGDENYIATLMTFKIAGYVLEQNYATPINDVNVSAENGGGPWTSRYGGGSWLTDANGYYEVVVDYNWSGKVVPAKYAYAFEPNKMEYVNVKSDSNDQDYTGTLLTFIISGHIKNSCDVPIAGVLVDANNGGGQNTTDVNGFYEVWVDYNWSGTVTPGKAHYTFDPNSNAYAYVLDDVIDQNYTATNIYDLDCDGTIGYGDLAVIAENWLKTPANINEGDLNNDNIVDFLDFAEFAKHWLEGPIL